MTHQAQPEARAVSEAALQGLPRFQPDRTSGPEFFWADYCQKATAAQQEELIALAGRQGILYTHQLPILKNGSAGPGVSHLLSHVLNGQIQELPSFPSAAFEPSDDALDEVQREAIARALATPDLFLVQGLPGTGKSRLIAELVTQAILRGERVLLHGATPAAVDQVLELIAGREHICSIRCLGASENPDELDPRIHAQTFGGRVRHLHKHALQGAQQEIKSAEEHCQRLQRNRTPLATCLELSGKSRRVEEQLARCQALREQVPGEVERLLKDALAGHEADNPLASEVAAASQAKQIQLEQIDRQLAELRRQLPECRQPLVGLTKGVSELRPLADAKQAGRWWTPTWWKATFAGNVIARMKELEYKLAAQQSQVNALEESIRQQETLRDQAEQTFQDACTRMKGAEIHKRQALLAEEEGVWQEQDRQVVAELARCMQDMDLQFRPAEPAPAAVRKAWENLIGQEEKAGQQLQQARHWLAALEQWAFSLPERLIRHVNLVAAPLGSLQAREPVADQALATLSFDLLVLDGAHQVTEAEFQAAACRARRWVLVGEPVPNRPEAAVNGTPAPEHFFTQLWQRLHSDPRSLPYVWFQEKDRLGCRLKPLAPEQRQRLESERVADFPDIELRILSQVRTPPQLVEVLFPPSMSLSQAKEYILRELQELAIRAAGNQYRWVEESDRLILRLSSHHVMHPLAIPLDKGIKEMVGTLREANGDASRAAATYTCCLEFDRAAGWQRRSAEDWIQRHLGVRNLGRTAFLDSPHRMHPELAALVGDVLLTDGCRYAASSVPASVHALVSGNGCARVFQFIPITPPAAPSNNAEASNRKKDNGRKAPRVVNPECDLADPRHRERVPGELRGSLPPKGYVHIAEAAVVVQTLENLTRDHALLAALERARLHQERVTIGVMALYASQAQVIRHMLRQSPSLELPELEIRVGTPEDFRERECLIGLVSLTRSHAHRAVTYGQGPDMVALALTRARARLIIIGDPETLTRRAQWEGPLDHLDRAAAARERALVSRLARLARESSGPAPMALALEGSLA